MAFTNAQCRAARALLNWTQDDLAAHSKITQKTIADFERGATRPHAHTLAQIATAFEAAGIEFLNSDEPGVRFARKSPGTRSTTPRGRS
jgi:transcriptional regulator with XRE-family HTH domain